MIVVFPDHTHLLFWFRNALYVKGILQYHVTHDVSVYFFLSFFTGSLIHEHYTRECEFGNFDKIKKKNTNNTKNTKTFG